MIGLGGVGLAAIQGARLAGAGSIIAVDRNTGKAALAAKLGASHFVAADEDTKKAVRALAGSEGVDYAFDCVGSARTIRDAWSMTRRGGGTCVVGIGGKDDKVSFSASCFTSPARSSGASPAPWTPVATCRGTSTTSGPAALTSPR